MTHFPPRGRPTSPLLTAVAAVALLTSACSEDLLIGNDPAPESATSTESSSGGGGMGSGAGTGGTGCPSEGWGQFTPLDHFSAETISPPGCSTEPDAAASSLRMFARTTTNPVLIELHVLRNDGGNFPFACDDCLVLYVGQGPTCDAPINVKKQDKAIGGHPEQTMLFKIDELYKEDWEWNEGETKQFWTSYETDTGFSASGMVLIERRCLPSAH